MTVVAFDEALDRWLAPARKRGSLAAELEATHAALAALLR